MLNTAVRAARQSGRIILMHYDRLDRIEITRKARNDYVSQADTEAEEIALEILLKHKLPYIGALGSRKTHAKRCARLQESGIPEERIQFIKGPAGLDIGATTAAEIALSMIGEVISAKRGTLA